MTNQDVFGTGFKVVPPGEPEVSEGIGCYRSVTLTSADGTQTLTMPLTAQSGNRQALFCVGFRLTPETGNLVACTMKFTINNGQTAEFQIGVEDITLNGYSASRIRPVSEFGMSPQLATYVTVGALQTTGEVLYYKDTNYGSKQIQPGVVYFFTANLTVDENGNGLSEFSHISLNGKKLLHDTHCAFTAGSGGLPITTTSDTINITLSVTGAIPIKMDFFNVYGAAFATPTGTDGTEYTEPLVNYNDWGAPTPENGRMYYTANPEIWQLNWNSVADPLGNVGINEGVFTGSSMAFSLADEEMFLHKTPDGMDWIVKIEDTLTSGSRYFYISFDTSLIAWDKQHFIVVMTECNGAPDNKYHPFTGFSCNTTKTSLSNNASYNCLVGCCRWFTQNNCETASMVDYAGKKYIQTINPAFGTPIKQKMLQTAWTGNSYLNHYTANKEVRAIGSRVQATYDNSQGTPLYFITVPESIVYDRRILYCAMYSADLIALHPEITWSDGLAMHNYFYKPDSYEVVDDLVNAVPGVQPTIVCYNARQIRGLGTERHSLPTYQEKIKSGNRDILCTPTDFYSTDMLVTGKFTAST